MQLSFIKMHGIGNDYVYVDCMREDIRLDAEAIRYLSDRRKGVGGDGVIFIRPAENAAGFMDMYNADGSAGKMCGNGVRCVGKFLFDNGYTDGPTFKVDTPSGLKTLTVTETDEQGKALCLSVDMGAPAFDPAAVPVLYEGSCVDIPLAVDAPPFGPEVAVTCLSMGNPHAVLFTKNVNTLDLERIGPAFHDHPLFPEGVNTEFCEVLSPTLIRMRVFERGSGETFACGTGACATAAAAIRKGFCQKDTDITVSLRGGDLLIRQSSKDDTITMTGAAATVFCGTAEL